MSKVEGDCYAFFEAGWTHSIKVPRHHVAIGYARGSKPVLFTVDPGHYVAQAMPDRTLPFVILVCPNEAACNFLAVDDEQIESIIGQAEMYKLQAELGGGITPCGHA